ncbi:PaaX family transcriptional regulator [Arthrobacter cryoconiti]|uniref:PaaX family transcriptional regulator C-terminal domain-containing protein n=1 Tax=Arthrobacter cryoconiti TaxID=748907 RepID=A0ABV8QY03_9MICC|nr:PaaX family transcriptional regulator C-terminal domain-containing protein [Arthrobacter cryoconiti]MCC9068222.1 PaaX family transcriptional regulator [Arthrobacter cryoconiti]
MTGHPQPSVRHQQLIITLFGLYSRDPGRAVPVSVLIEMLGSLGYDAPGVRSSVSRLKAKGVLRSVKSNNVAQYTLEEGLADVFREGDDRIFSPVGANLGDGWILAIFSVPESLRSRRHTLRTELLNFGFGFISSGVWIAPVSVLDRVRSRLVALKLDQFVDFFSGDYVADGSMREKVAQWWDLTHLDEQFGEFLEFYGDAVNHWTALVGSDPGLALEESTPELRLEAFKYYIPMLTLWRRFPYKDPNLRSELLPEGWKGAAARETFLAVHKLIAPLADAHAKTLLTLA